MPWRLNAVQACKEEYFQNSLHTTHAHMDGEGGVEKTHNKLKKYTFFCIFLWSYFSMYEYKIHADIHAQQHTYTEKQTQHTTFVFVTFSPEFAYDYCEIWQNPISSHFHISSEAIVKPAAGQHVMLNLVSVMWQAPCTIRWGEGCNRNCSTGSTGCAPAALLRAQLTDIEMAQAVLSV